MEDIDKATVKVQVLVLLLQSELPQTANASMMAHMTDSSNITVCNVDPNERPQLGTFYEAFCKTGTYTEGLIRITAKTGLQTSTGIGITKKIHESIWEAPVQTEKSSLMEVSRDHKIPQYITNGRSYHD